MPLDHRRKPRSAPAGSELVRCVHVPSTGRAHGALTVRVGAADESVPVRGITHLVEHLVMRAAHDVDLRCNASVDLTRTTFWATGTEAEVAGFLDRVGRALLDVPVEHLDSERELIGVEEEHHPTGLPSPVQHFGAQRYGVVHFEQQLDHVDAEQVRSWVRDRFTAANAVLTLVGVDPRRVPLHLPPGRPHPEPPVPGRPAGPTLHVDPSERTTTLTALLPSSWELEVLLGVLDRAVANRLRHVEHLAYGARADGVRITRETTMVVLTSDCVPGREDLLVAALLDELHGLVRRLDDDLVLRAVARTVAAATEGAASAGVTEAALDLLHGGPAPVRPATMEAELEAMTTGSLQDLLRRLLADCVLRTPVPVHPPGTWRTDDGPAPATWTAGRTFASTDGTRRLALSSQGLTETGPAGTRQLTWSSIVAAFTTAESWTLVSRRGVHLDVRPADWAGARELLAELGDRVPTAARVPGRWRRARVRGG